MIEKTDMGLTANEQKQIDLLKGFIQFYFSSKAIDVNWERTGMQRKTIELIRTLNKTDDNGKEE